MRPLRAPLLVLALAAPSAFAATGDAEGHVNVFLGQKTFDSGDWDPVDKQREFGAVMSFGRSDWPVFIAADVMTSAKERDVVDDWAGPATLTAGTFEAAFGVRKIWKPGSTHPYLGGGITLVRATAELDAGSATFDGDDSGIGLWLGGGVFWRLGSRIQLGFDLRWSDAKVVLDLGQGVTVNDVKAGGFHSGIMLGFGW